MTDTTEFSFWFFDKSNLKNTDDPVYKLREKYKNHMKWPVDAQSVDDLKAFISDVINEEAKNRIKSETYILSLAWNDFEQYKKEKVND